MFYQSFVAKDASQPPRDLTVQKSLKFQRHKPIEKACIAKYYSMHCTEYSAHTNADGAFGLQRWAQLGGKD